MIRLFRKKKEVTPDDVTRQFIRDMIELIEMISGKIMRSTRKEEIEVELNMMRELASKGSLDMLRLLGLTFLDQSKEWYDYSEGFGYLNSAAEKGMVEAQYDLGLLYYHGAPEARPDPVMGHLWMVKSADGNYEPAVEFLNSRR